MRAAQGTSHEKRVVRGYKAQSALVMPGVVGALRRVAARHESVVVEGIHLRPRTLLAMTAELEARRERGHGGRKCMGASPA